MQEFEIKFQLDPKRRAAVEAELVRGAAAGQRVHLRARYFDTAGRDLARAGIALRLRQEGRRWVQTLKAAGEDALSRFEHNVPVVARGEVAVDPQRHAGTPVGERLLMLIAETGPLLEQYRTDVWRRTRTLRGRQGQLELALDQGEILSGPQRLPICELEIELLQGEPAAVLEAAGRWAAKHGLWLDVRSKAERGDRLAQGVQSVPARKAGSVALPESASVHEAWAAVVASALRHLLPNASELADAAEPETDEARQRATEQVHQMRVALRRLRTALRFFEGWQGVPPEAELNAVQEASSTLFSQLGLTRDRDVLDALLAPVLAQAGVPALHWPEDAEPVSPREALRAPSTQALWLELMRWSYAAPPEQATPLKDLASQRLKRWHKRVVERADAFLEMIDEERHTLRKRIKRLRYGVDFVESLYPKREVKRYLSALAEAQEVFGQFNDLCMAQDALAGLDEPGAWFARGWVTARRGPLLAQCQDALKALADAKKFWK